MRHAQTPIFEGVFDGIFADNENCKTYINGISEALDGLGTTTFAEENEDSETDTGDKNEDEQQSTQTAGETTDSAPGISSATSSVDDSEPGPSNKKSKSTKESYSKVLKCPFHFIPVEKQKQYTVVAVDPNEEVFEKPKRKKGNQYNQI